MIQQLANNHQQKIAYVLLLIFYAGFAVPIYAGNRSAQYRMPYTGNGQFYNPGNNPRKDNNKIVVEKVEKPAIVRGEAIKEDKIAYERVDIGGPSQPEMSSFKSVGTNDMVNLFTGDFSYNIPLMDVGGYPVNIFYDGGVTMEQDASWVGLGWNINPGTISRNMRGVPDDFDGTDKLKISQNIKPNITWGGRLGVDFEFIGLENIGVSVGAGLGVSFNNYLGPGLDMGIRGGVSFTLASKTSGDKSTGDTTGSLKLSLGLDANNSSRYGLSLSPNMSLSGMLSQNEYSLGGGIGLGTTYNSRTGIQALNVSSSASLTKSAEKTKANQIGKDVNGDPIYASNSMGANLLGSTISFTRPSYIPEIRMPITNEANAGRFEIGGAMFGGKASAEIEIYRQKSAIADNDVIQEKPIVGYLYYEKANGKNNVVMDFARLNEREVTPHTPIISAPQYSYDIYSISGEGTGGTIRPYRNDLGYVRDARADSKDKSFSAGVDVGIPGHIGANFNMVKTPSTSGEWVIGNKLRKVIPFKTADGLWENVYFRNPGESSVLTPGQFDQIGGADMVRFQLGGTNSNPTIEPKLERVSPGQEVLGTVDLTQSFAANNERKKRSQVVSFLKASEAKEVGLEKEIRSYDQQTILENNVLKYQTIDRAAGTIRKNHHISQIDITEADGKRYVYGLPVYNIVQKDYTFSVIAEGDGDDKVGVSANETNAKTSGHITGNTGRDGYVQVTETPPYAHSFLLSGLLSPDYVDVTGNGITEDDLGSAVKFNYSQMGDYEWKTPVNQDKANFNPGLLTEVKDDKGIISYGKRESWYMHSIESKTMIALFSLDNRHDGKGVNGELGGIKTNDNATKRLKKIDLYNKADLRKNGITNAKPVKTVWFEYDYSLCNNVPDNDGVAEAGNENKGKLTLKGIYFTYNGKSRQNKDRYAFTYNNAAYKANASDRWGNYKPKDRNPGEPGLEMRNRDFPYSIQPTDQTEKNEINQDAAAWSLTKVLLPSGGQINVEYESDDYAYVQNKRAAAMMKLSNLSTTNPVVINPVKSNRLYDQTSAGTIENDKVYISVPEVCANKQEVKEKYLQGVTQLAFKLAVQMPKGIEYVPVYAGIDDYGIESPTVPVIWIKLAKVDGYSPLSLTAIEFLREQLPGQAYAPGYDLSGQTGLKQFTGMLEQMFKNVLHAFKSPLNYLRSYGYAQTIDLQKSFVRLNVPGGNKYGGGQRVKSVRLRDAWNRMTGQYTAEYGQVYDYTTTEVFNGKQRSISSGVASYEPTIGGEENPFQTIVQVANRMPAGPTSYGALEMPVLDGFFPAPVVGYSKVTVRSVKKGAQQAGEKSRSGIGKQVTEFFTAKDYPVYYNHTALSPATDKQEHSGSKLAFFHKWAFDSRALSQGFIVAVNDMHGKMKLQASYPENDDNTPVNYTRNYYRNTGANGMGDLFQFVSNKTTGGEISNGYMGIDIELMTDTREFRVRSTSLDVQAQVDWMVPWPTIWLPFIWPTAGESENTYRAVTTTKMISYHSILEKTIAIDKGSQVSTENIVFDAETGDVIVNKTNNAFDKPIYSTSYPAHWAYSGMGTAYKNIDAVFSGVNFQDGKITGAMTPALDPKNVFESGDEIYILDPGGAATGCSAGFTSGSGIKKIWAFDKNKNTSSLTNTNPDFVFLTETGEIYSRSNVKMRIIRSGKRNMSGATVGAISSLKSPIVAGKIQVTLATDVINTSAIEFKEKRQIDKEVIQRFKTTYNPISCSYDETSDCSGYLEKKINPYVKGLLGAFRLHKEYVFYGSRGKPNSGGIFEEPDGPGTQTDIRTDGVLKGFFPYWSFNSVHNLIPSAVNPSPWIWRNEITRINARGLELETRDALNIYTAAQYGYNKTAPVAIANNSRYGEMLYLGFEENDYNEKLSAGGNVICDNQRYISIDPLRIINESTTGGKAHSGKRVLEIEANSAYNKEVSVNNSFNEEFAIEVQSDVVKSLYDAGGNYTDLGLPPVYYNPNFPSYLIPYVSNSLSCTNLNYGWFPENIPYSNLGTSLTWNRPGNIFFDECDPECIIPPGTTTQYISVEQNTTFTITIGQKDVYAAATAPPTHPNYFKEKVLIYTLDDVFVAAFDGPPNVLRPSGNVYTTESTTSNSVYLCSGKYKVHFLVYQTIPNYTCFTQVSSYYSFDQSLTSYKTLSTQNGCSYTKPIVATELMTHPVFAIPSTKKMLFSGWVRETCTGPCSSYTGSQAKVQFNDGSSTQVNFQHTGPIIEGWQKIEGEFTVPAGATTMQLQLVNTTSNPIYFDDIRIHPYNANMKTYVYDPVNLRLVAEQDANNYSVFYEYDEEGGLIRTKAETREGIKTIKETRSAKQKNITSAE